MSEPADISTLRVNGARLRRSLEEMAAIGATAGGGVHRLTASDEDRRARDLLVSWLDEAGAAVAVDDMGNVFGRRAGTDESLAPVLTGSHLDSQPLGGRFDGTLGVLGALEVFRTLRDHDVQTRRAVELVDWTNEEGSRFPPAMMASGVWAGALDRDWACARTDVDGRRFGDELERIGYRGPAPCARRPFHACYELHVEQGPLLERAGCTIGVPRGIVCLQWYDVHVEGVANQVGPTPMAGRADALVAAAGMVLAVQDTPARLGGGLVATVGELHVTPNSRNVVPGRARFTVDIRSWDDDLALRAWESLREQFFEIAAGQGCAVRVEEVWRVQHNEFAPGLVARVRDTARRLGLSTLDLESGAGHDATYLATVGPTAMVFVPSVGGRSHVELEETSWEDCEAGADVLLQCILASADEGDGEGPDA
jgi:beta-ureidopropionase / N-carbamoyl-L-amino-acid hydrolase